jgi:hypothetical protein
LSAPLPLLLLALALPLRVTCGACCMPECRDPKPPAALPLNPAAAAAAAAAAAGWPVPGRPWGPMLVLKLPGPCEWAGIWPKGCHCWPICMLLPAKPICCCCC